MRVMVLITADADTEAGILPGEELLAAMGRFNEELAAAGVLLGGEGLKATAHGRRVVFEGDERRVVDGPFPLTDRPVCGFWLWQVKDLDEAVDWLRRCPPPLRGRAEIEIRPLFEVEDFGEAMTPDLRAQEDRLRAGLQAGA